jgi:hypothetical protein
MKTPTTRTTTQLEQARILAQEYADLHARGDYGGRDHDIRRTIHDLVGRFVHRNNRYVFEVPAEIRRLMRGTERKSA